MAKKEIGKQSVEFDCPPLIVGAASVVEIGRAHV